MSLVRTVITVVTRLICIAFVVFAAFAIPEAWSLNDEGYQVVGSTLYVPIHMCEPQSITVGDPAANNTIVFEDGEEKECHTLEYLINACVASIIFAMGAMIIFFLFDTLARCNKGPVSRASVLGMSFFMTFILVQAAACSYALYNQMDFWETYFQKQFADMKDQEITDVKTHGNKNFVFINFVLALTAAGAMLFDTLTLIFCCSDNSGARRQPKKSEQPAVAAASDNLNQTTDERVEQAPPAVEEEDEIMGSGGKPAWTNV